LSKKNRTPNKKPRSSPEFGSLRHYAIEWRCGTYDGILHD